jgi:hypothetical protein
MTMSRTAAFLRGERPEDIAIYLPAETLSGTDELRQQAFAEETDDGVMLVVPGEEGQAMFEEVTGTDPMTFAGSAMGTPGHIDGDLTGGECPNAIEGPQEHAVRFIFAFAEEQNEDVGGIYAEGDVIHAYAQCACGETYTDKWVVGEREE